MEQKKNKSDESGIKVSSIQMVTKHYAFGYRSSPITEGLL